MTLSRFPKDIGDSPRIRAGFTCPKCLGPKDPGLVLCWPCHHDEKRYNGGGYSDSTERLIMAYEGYLYRAARRRFGL
jgi:hypothetical protein